MRAVIWLLLACAEPNEAGQDALAMVHALDASLPLDQVLSECETIGDEQGRGDCKTAAVISHHGTQLSDCQAIEVPDWQAECVFRLAERTRVNSLSKAAEICSAGRFSRECMGHLIRDEAQERIAAPLSENQAQATYLVALTGRSEAVGLYWEEWALARYRADLLVHREQCAALEELAPCVQGQRRARQRLLRELGDTHLCEAYARGWPELSTSTGQAQFNTSVPSGRELETRCSAAGE